MPSTRSRKSEENHVEGRKDSRRSNRSVFPDLVRADSRCDLVDRQRFGLVRLVAGWSRRSTWTPVFRNNPAAAMGDIEHQGRKS
jgi:hypothetical protein